KNTSTSEAPSSLTFWTSHFRFSKEDRWGITAGMCSIGRAFHQWEMEKLSTDGSFTLLSALF
ncbi:hypothetical protein WAZ07_24400, partial [Bacillus sp. FJAT-51639]